MILAVLMACAHASGLQARTHREPLPAREVERPLVIPRGWTRVEVIGGRQISDTQRQLTERVAVRTGLLPGHELFAAVAWHQVDDGVAGRGDAELGWRISLLRREPPNTSVRAELSTRVPSGWLGASRAADATLAVAARRALGGLALEGDVVGTASSGGVRVGARAGALLQAGPLYGVADLRWHAGDLGTRAGLAAQLTRGLDVALWTERALDGRPMRALGLTLGIAL